MNQKGIALGEESKLFAQGAANMNPVFRRDLHEVDILRRIGHEFVGQWPPEAEACALYNEYAVSSVATFDLAPRDMTTFAAGYLKAPNFGCVARDEAGALAGFVSLGPFIHRAAAAQSVEIALYLRAPDE